ncbi:hypothetical protein BFW90_18990 [Pseudomonas fluorescens]|nr:hypothetical protein BFW90_18990 [Pseudomonas fluorescens]
MPHHYLGESLDMQVRLHTQGLLSDNLMLIGSVIVAYQEVPCAIEALTQHVQRAKIYAGDV